MTESKPLYRNNAECIITLYILPDADAEGEEAAREWVRKLYPKALLCPAEYGGEAEDA